MIKYLEHDNLSEVVSQHDKVLVFYMADWYANCLMLKPKFEEISFENEDTTFVMVDAEKQPKSCSLAEVKKIPTFATFNSGKYTQKISTTDFSSVKELAEDLEKLKICS